LIFRWYVLLPCRRMSKKAVWKRFPRREQGIGTPDEFDAMTQSQTPIDKGPCRKLGLHSRTQVASRAAAIADASEARGGTAPGTVAPEG